MDVQNQILDITEQKAVSEALVRMIQASPMITGSKIKVRHGTVDLNTIGEFAQQGTVYVKQYVSGSFVGQYAFFLRYRVKPTSDKDKIKEEHRLDALSRWLEAQKVEWNGQTYRLAVYPPLDEQRQIEAITNTSGVFMADAADNGTVDYQVHMALRYFKST